MDLAPWRHGQRPRREGKEGHPLGVVGAAWPDGARGLEAVLAGHAPVYGDHAEEAPQSLAGHLLRKAARLRHASRLRRLLRPPWAAMPAPRAGLPPVAPKPLRRACAVRSPSFPARRPCRPRRWGCSPQVAGGGGNKKGFFLATSAFARILFSRSPPLIVPIELQLRVLLASQRFACWTAMPCGQEEQPGELLRTSIIGKSASRTQVRPRRFPNAKQAPAFLWERRSLHCSLAVAER